jgi:glycosyltransferase involved in cell wall biosynthesis
MFPLGDKTTRIFPQGINIDSEHLSEGRRADLRTALRGRLGLAAEDILVLGCGFGTFRKGVDLFVQAARETAACSESAGTGRIVFAWVGQLQSDFQAWAEKDVIELNLSGRLILPGQQREMAPWFAAADIFFLSSREDPFPTVVLEAMASGLPVVGFSGTGGYEEQARGGAGLTVPYADVASAVRTLRRLAEQPGERAETGRVGRERVEAWGGYSGYVRDLLNLLSATRVESADKSDSGSLRGSGR